MSAARDLTGQKIEKLLLLERKREDDRTYYYCECDCGNKLWIRADTLRTAKSCGCIREEKIKKNSSNLYKKHLDKNIVCGTNLAIIKNSNARIDNKSGYKGVSWDSSRRKWLAQIRLKGKHYFLGRHLKKEDAIKARKKAEENLFGEFLEWYNKEYKGSR